MKIPAIPAFKNVSMCETCVLLASVLYVAIECVLVYFYY
jgi:hypothetical protein